MLGGYEAKMKHANKKTIMIINHSRNIAGDASNLLLTTPLTEGSGEGTYVHKPISSNPVGTSTP